MTLRAVITAGGTSEPIDDVRVITNLSTGRFGAAIADALVARGVSVTLLASNALARQQDWIPAGARVIPFGSFAALSRALSDALDDPPDLLFMAAAVSDYSPTPAAGKLSSDGEAMTLHMTRNPKLLAGLRDRCPTTYLVGFKLLSGVTDTELRDVAQRQAVDCRLDLTMANDLQHLSAERHPAVLVSPNGETFPIVGSKRESASQLVIHCLKALGHHAAPQRPTVSQWISRSRATPILDSGEEVGILTHHEDGYCAIFLFAHARGRGIGDRVIESVDRRVVTTEETAPWFIERGFRTTDRQGPLHFLDPPSMRDDLLPSASVCLVDPVANTVLIGRRKTTSFHGYWAFPGGRQEPDETLRACALRELEEETGLTPKVGVPVTVSTVHVSTGNGKRAWQVTNFAWLCETPEDPRETEELAAVWMPIDQLPELRPMAAGTRRVLRKLLASLAAKK